MNTDNSIKAKRLLMCIGEIDESFLEEEETADIAADIAARKQRVKRGALTAAASIGAASIGIAVTYWVMRSRRIRSA